MQEQKGGSISSLVESIKAFNDVPVTRLSPGEHVRSLQTADTTRRNIREMLSGETIREYVDRYGDALHLATGSIVLPGIDLQVTRYINNNKGVKLYPGIRLSPPTMEIYQFYKEEVIKTTCDKVWDHGQYVSQPPEKHEASHEELMNLTQLLQTSRPNISP